MNNPKEYEPNDPLGFVLSDLLYTNYPGIAAKLHSMETWDEEELLVAMGQFDENNSITEKAKQIILDRIETCLPQKEDNKWADRRNIIFRLFMARKGNWELNQTRNMIVSVRELIKSRPDLFIKDMDLMLRVFIASTYREPTREGNDSSDLSAALSFVLQYGRAHDLIPNDFSYSIDSVEITPDTLAKLALVEYWKWTKGIDEGKWGGDVLQQNGWLCLIKELTDHFGALSSHPEIIASIDQQEWNFLERFVAISH